MSSNQWTDLETHVFETVMCTIELTTSELFVTYRGSGEGRGVVIWKDKTSTVRFYFCFVLHIGERKDKPRTLTLLIQTHCELHVLK